MIIDLPFSFIDVGFNTQSRKWMIEFYDVQGMQSGVHMVKSVEMINASGQQFAFKIPMSGQNIWHVRERYYKDDIETIEISADLAVIKGAITYKPFTVPENYKFIRYNYSLKHNIAKVIFLDGDHKEIDTCVRRMLLVDRLDHKTFDGNYPKIFLECAKSDLREIVITDSYIVLVGTGTQIQTNAVLVDNAPVIPTHSTSEPKIVHKIDTRRHK